MNARIAAVALAALALLALPMPASAAKHPKSAVREFTGTVASVSGKGKKTFRLRRTGRAAIVVQLSRRTKVAKGARPSKGRKLVVKARRAPKGRWLARSVKLVPVVADDDDEVSDADDVLDDEPVAGDEEGEDSDPTLDLEDTLGDIFGDDDGSDEEPE